MYLLTDRDSRKFIATHEHGRDAVKLATDLSAKQRTEIAIIYNSPNGQAEVCCRARDGELEVVRGTCFPAPERWVRKLIALLRRKK